MNKGEFIKRSKSGEEIDEHIDACWDRHCTHLNMKEEEVPAYEKDLKECNEERWVSEKVLDDARKEIFETFPEEKVIGTTVSGDGEEYNDEGYAKEDVEKLRGILLKWFG
jgi:hypothetical protein